MIGQSMLRTTAVGTALFAGLSHPTPSGNGAAAPSACSLLTVQEVSAALEVQSLPGKALFGRSSACIWSDDAAQSINHRRVTLSIVNTTAVFNNMKTSPRLSTEPVTGIGDDAYYVLLKSESPQLAVRKGGNVIQIRVLDGLKEKPFTLAQQKAKEAALAKAAVARI